MTSQVLRKLEAKRLLQRRVDPSDSRAEHLSVTPAGADLARRAITEVERVDAEVLGDAAPALTDVLQRLAAAPRPETLLGYDPSALGQRNDIGREETR